MPNKVRHSVAPRELLTQDHKFGRRTEIVPWPLEQRPYIYITLNVCLKKGLPNMDVYYGYFKTFPKNSWL